MKMTVRLLVCVFALVLAEPNDPTQIEKYHDRIKTYQLDVPGKDPITIIEDRNDATKWKDITSNSKQDEAEIKNLMTTIIHDLDGSKPRCYGPSCRDGFEDTGIKDSGEGIEDFEDYMLAAEKLKDYSDLSKDRLQAITALAAKLKKEKLKYHNMYSMQNEQSSQDEGDDDNDGNGKVYTTWNRLKVKQHKHPYDDKDGWVSLEPVAWSTSKISKWKPNVKKQKPNHWNEDDNRFPDDDERYPPAQDSGSYFNSYPQKKPSLTRPAYINNKLHIPSDIETELPSRPSWASSSSSSPSWQSQSSSSTWTKPQKIPQNHPLSWAPDEGRRPHKPNCDSDHSDENYPNDDSVYYSMSDSVVTDPRPPNFPYEYEALHQSSMNKRPQKRPTQVVYAGSEYESDKSPVRPYGDSSRPPYSDSSRPPYGDGQWVLLSTTKGYRNKKRQRSLNPVPEAADRVDVSTMTSHQAVALTVLPVDNAHTNMTTSHGGMLEVEKSFQTVEESKRDMDKKNDLETAASQIRPVKNRVIRRKIVSNVSPDSSTLLAAVGAGMVPATMAMVVPMMLGRRRRRRNVRESPVLHLDNMFRYR